jgi:hypothetical protein
MAEFRSVVAPSPEAPSPRLLWLLSTIILALREALCYAYEVVRELDTRLMEYISLHKSWTTGLGIAFILLLTYGVMGGRGWAKHSPGIHIAK